MKYKQLSFAQWLLFPKPVNKINIIQDSPHGNQLN